jgi:hypothetical protein
MSYAGYIVVLDEPARRDWLQSRRDVAEFDGGDWGFTDTLSAPDWDPKKVEICFLSFGGAALDVVSLAKRGRRVATAKYAVTFSHMVDLRAIPLADIDARLGSNVRPHFVRSSSGRGSRVPEGTWAALVRSVKEARPELARELDRLDALRQSSAHPLSGHGISQLAMERDAVGVALDIFGADRKAILSGWSSPLEVGVEPLAPFLAGLKSVHVREDQILAHDARVFPGWNLIAHQQVGAATFRKGRGEYLTIYNVNRTPVEGAIGVDLVYYNYRYAAYVLVQYKRLVRDHPDRGEPVFRLSSGSYENEVERMRRFVAANPSLPCDAPDRYRLEPAAFYFKLCQAETVTPLSSELITGMYLPLPYWELLLASGALTGPKGGLRVSSGAARRHLANGPFVQLVQDGWIGSRGAVSEAITTVIRDRLDEGNSVLVAASGVDEAGDGAAEN